MPDWRQIEDDIEAIEDDEERERAWAHFDVEVDLAIERKWEREHNHE